MVRELFTSLYHKIRRRKATGGDTPTLWFRLDESLLDSGYKLKA